MINSFNDEFDCLIFLAKHRLILGIEAKQAITKNREANDNQAKEAAKQVKKREEYIRKTFGELLDKGWRYVKIIALYDHQGSIVKNKCPDCAPYILTNGTEAEQKQQMIDLMAALNCNSGGATTKRNIRHALIGICSSSELSVAERRGFFLGGIYNVFVLVSQDN